MIRFDFNIPIYDWSVTVVQIQSEDDYKELQDLLSKMTDDNEVIEKECEYVKKSYCDGGDTWRDFDSREALIVLFRSTSREKLCEVVNHEKRHLIDRILQWAHIDDFEAAAYLDGYVSKQIFTKLNMV